MMCGLMVSITSIIYLDMVDFFVKGDCFKQALTIILTPMEAIHG